MCGMWSCRDGVKPRKQRWPGETWCPRDMVPSNVSISRIRYLSEKEVKEGKLKGGLGSTNEQCGNHKKAFVLCCYYSNFKPEQ